MDAQYVIGSISSKMTTVIRVFIWRNKSSRLLMKSFLNNAEFAWILIKLKLTVVYSHEKKILEEKFM